MAVVISANNVLGVNDVSTWFWTVINALKTSAGWTQLGSGDGATYANGSAGPVANAAGLATSGSWVRLQKTCQSVVYELMFYSGGTGAGSVLVSADSAFTGGSPSATQRPTATSEEFLPNFGGGTAGSPSHASFCTGTPNALLHFKCDTTTPFGFFAWSYDPGTRANNHCLGMLPLTNTYGSPASPYIFVSGDYTTSLSVTSGFAKTRRRHGVSGAAWESVDLGGIGSLFPHGAGNNPNSTSYVDLVEVTCGTASKGRHGAVSWLRWSSTSHGNSTLYSVNTTGDRIVVGALVLTGWDNTVPS